MMFDHFETDQTMGVADRQHCYNIYHTLQQCDMVIGYSRYESVCLLTKPSAASIHKCCRISDLLCLCSVRTL